MNQKMPMITPLQPLDRNMEKHVLRPLWCDWCEQYQPHNVGKMMLRCEICKKCWSCGATTVALCLECKAFNAAHARGLMVAFLMWWPL